MPQEQGFFDKVSKEIGSAISDVREKFEESVWGKVVNKSDTQTGPQWPQAREPEQEASFGGIKRTIDMGNPTHDQMGNANFRLAAMERELNGPQWPKATGHAQNIGQERDRDQDREMDR
jgi:hypothetical protein